MYPNPAQLKNPQNTIKKKTTKHCLKKEEENGNTLERMYPCTMKYPGIINVC
jgi:hypothetical protein